MMENSDGSILGNAILCLQARLFVQNMGVRASTYSRQVHIERDCDTRGCVVLNSAVISLTYFSIFLFVCSVFFSLLNEQSGVWQPLVTLKGETWPIVCRTVSTGCQWLRPLC